MQVKLTSAATLPEVLKRLGVDDTELAGVAARVASAAHLDVATPLPAGHVLDIGDDVFVPRAFAKSAPSSSAPASSTASPVTVAPLAKSLGALGLFGVQAAHSARTGDNDLGKLPSLSSIELLGLAGALVDKATLAVKVPLRPGMHAIPLGDKRVRVEVPPGTVLSLSVRLGSGPTTSPGRAGAESGSGLAVQAADVAFSKSVGVLNPADLSFADKSFLGDVANALVQVKLDGVHVGADGSVTPKGTVSRPSMNLLKHVFSTGRSENALESLVSLVGKPKVATSLDALVRGDVVTDKTAFAASDIPSHFDIGALLQSLGALADGGSFSLRVDGRSGFVDVGKGRVQLVGKDQKLSCTVTGDFRVEDRGRAVSVDAEAKTAGLSVPVAVSFDDSGAPGVTAGSLGVRASEDGAIHVSVGGALLGAVRALADRFHVAIPPGVSLAFDGQSLVSGHAKISAKDGGVVVEHGSVRAVVDAAGSRAHADTLDVTLGTGSQIALQADGISLKNGDLVVESAGAGFTATATGVARKGPLTLQVDGANAEGTLAVRFDDGVRAEGNAAWSLKAAPKLGFMPLPGKADVAGDARVVLVNDAVAWQSGSKLRVRL